MPGSVRYPRCYVVIDGARVPALEVGATRSAARTSDTFDATISLSAAKLHAGLTINDFADWQPTDVSVLASLEPGGADERELMVGRVDTPEINWDAMLVSLNGRDKSASLIDKRRSELFQNQSVEDVVKKIAGEHGLSAQITLAKPGDAGNSFDQDAAHRVLNRSDWETLSGLADRTGCRWFVEGSTLFFEPKDAQAGALQIVWVPPTPEEMASGNALSLRTTRNMTAARPVEANVRSWHAQDKKKYEHTARRGGVGEPLIYEEHYSDKDQARVEQLAESRADAAIRHDLSVQIRMPADLNVTPRMTLELSGTGTIFDQPYEIDGLDMSIATRGGATMDITANAAKAGRAG